MIIANNQKIKEALIARWKQLDVYSENDGRASYKEIVRDAMERAPEMKITGDRLSKYLSGYVWDGKIAGLTDDQCLWLATRWGVFVKLTVGEPVIKGNQIEYRIPVYDEHRCLEELKVVEQIIKANKKAKK
jgi:hypothetical protein